VPIACTLEPSDMPDRMVAWRDVAGHGRSRTTAADGTLRVELDDTIDIGELARLVAAEQHCCAFFSFAITVDHRGIALEVGAPDGASDIVTSLFGQPEPGTTTPDS
jgi:MerR family copper efflux transcriptional regulator